MIKYGLILSVFVSSSLLAMNQKEDLTALSEQALKQRWDNAIREQSAFYAKYTLDDRRNNAALQAESDRLTAEHRRLMNAVMFGAISRPELIKPHCVTNNESVINLPISPKKHCRTIEEIQGTSNHSIDKTAESNSNNNKAKGLSFEEIFKANSFEKTKKIKTLDEDEAELKKRIAALTAEQDAIFEIVDNTTLAKMAQRSDDIEDELQFLNEQLSALRKK